MAKKKKRESAGSGPSSSLSLAAQFAQALAAGELDDILASNGWQKKPVAAKHKEEIRKKEQER